MQQPENILTEDDKKLILIIKVQVWSSFGWYGHISKDETCGIESIWQYCNSICETIVIHILLSNLIYFFTLMIFTPSKTVRGNEYQHKVQLN